MASLKDPISLIRVDMFNNKQILESMGNTLSKISGTSLKALFLFLICSLLLVGLPGCSGKGKGNPADTPSPESALSPDDTPAQQPADVYLTAEGIGPVTVGMKVGEIPESIDGLYDAVVAEEGYESNSYVFMREGEALFTAYEFTPGTLDVISADSPSVMVKTPDGETISLGSPFSMVIALKGAVAEWENADGEGMWCWRWEGIWFQPDQHGLSDVLSKELYNEIAPPSKSSFTPDVTVGYIGTGLPW